MLETKTNLSTFQLQLFFNVSTFNFVFMVLDKNRIIIENFPAIAISSLHQSLILSAMGIFLVFPVCHWGGIFADWCPFAPHQNFRTMLICYESVQTVQSRLVIDGCKRRFPDFLKGLLGEDFTSFGILAYSNFNHKIRLT